MTFIEQRGTQMTYLNQTITLAARKGLVIAEETKGKRTLLTVQMHDGRTLKTDTRMVEPVPTWNTATGLIDLRALRSSDFTITEGRR